MPPNIEDYIPAAKTSGLKFGDGVLEVVAVTVSSGAATGTATVSDSAVPLCAAPTGNQDQFIDNMAVSDTTLTVTLAANATADNTFNVFLLRSAS